MSLLTGCRYVALLLVLTLPPALNHGIGLEAHCQNVLARFDKKSGTLTGFAIRDFGGLKLHMPTLRSQGFDLLSSPPGSLITTNDLQEVWMNVHHTIFQSHLNQIIHGLKLQRQGGWAIVRDELYKSLRPGDSGKAKAFYDFLTADKMPMKCFLRMKTQGLYRDVSTDDKFCCRNSDEGLVHPSRCTQRTPEFIAQSIRIWGKSHDFPPQMPLIEG